jgi:hypothetical protein
MSAKLLLDTLMLVDGGKVECRVQAPDGTVIRGVIEENFFEDFMGAPKPVISPQQRGRIIQENLAYLEKRAEEEWNAGSRELVIR